MQARNGLRCGGCGHLRPGAIVGAINNAAAGGIWPATHPAPYPNWTVNGDGTVVVPAGTTPPAWTIRPGAAAPPVGAPPVAAAPVAAAPVAAAPAPAQTHDVNLRGVPGVSTGVLIIALILTALVVGIAVYAATKLGGSDEHSAHDGGPVVVTPAPPTPPVVQQPAPQPPVVVYPGQPQQGYGHFRVRVMIPVGMVQQQPPPQPVVVQPPVNVQVILTDGGAAPVADAAHNG